MKKHLISLAIILPSLLIYAQVPTIERDALNALFNATDGPNWTFPGQWGSTTIPVADWFGVGVENIAGQDHVTGIFLNLNGLNGSIPSEVENLTYLKGLDLGGNQLPGDIPIFLFNLTLLEYLFLEVCQLTGTIPIEIGNLTNLGALSLSGNQLTGNIPVEFGNLSNIWSIDLRHNQFSGTIPIEIENLTSLGGLGLSYNEFSGDLDLSNLSNLHALLIDNNYFSSINVKNGNNTNFDFFNITNNPNLICVFVDDKNWSEANWPNKDESAQYFETQTACDTYLVIDDNQLKTNYYLYPNPTNDMVYVDLEQGVNIKKIEIYTVLGKHIKSIYKSNRINLSDFSQGVYYFRILDDVSNSSFYKIIKK
jgi:hypothetical protein